MNKKVTTSLSAKRKIYSGRKGARLVGDPLRPPITMGKKQILKLDYLIEKMNRDINREIVRLFKSDGKSFFSQDASIASQLGIIFRRLQKKYINAFKEVSDVISEEIVSQQDKSSQSALEQSFKRMTGGVTVSSKIYTSKLRETLKASVNNAADLIVSIPQQYLDSVRTPITQLISNPRSAGLSGAIAEIDKICKKHGKQTRNRARLLTMDQSRKVFNSINAERMQAAGISKFRWIHSGGSFQPRGYHRDILNGQVFSFDDPPIIDKKTGERGFPSQAINCKCVMQPVLDFE